MFNNLKNFESMFSNFLKSIGSWVSEHPWTSVGIAAGAGAVAGYKYAESEQEEEDDEQSSDDNKKSDKKKSDKKSDD